MNIEELKKTVEKTLKEMGCTRIQLIETSNKEGVTATFDCKTLTSFKAEISGWTFSGINLDPTSVRQYKIDFIKLPLPN